ncbi:hypothetical protein EYF80_045018 [Liparis tanakae]|uniref:Uncharacterized protein n=1 Tax=Liparis tanakae TaxID=230148 RepID=A0A4Z2FUE4_9TELE|nr:hypothetical protein EYF80_045018 [Liparis tanakae]
MSGPLDPLSGPLDPLSGPQDPCLFVRSRRLLSGRVGRTFFNDPFERRGRTRWHPTVLLNHGASGEALPSSRRASSSGFHPSRQRERSRPSARRSSLESLEHGKRFHGSLL